MTNGRAVTETVAAKSSRSSLRYALLGVVVLGFSLVGYVGFVIYPGLDLSAGVGIGLLILAAAAGVASFFSPCSFALLVGMLARPVNDRTSDSGRPVPTRDSLAFAGALSLGVIAFLALLGTVIAFGGEALVKDVTFASTAGKALRIGVGAFLIFVGLIQLGRVQVSMRRFEPAMQSFLRSQRRGRTRTERPFRRFVLFGFGYLAAGFG